MKKIFKLKEHENLQLGLVCIYSTLVLLSLLSISLMGWTTFWGKLRIPTMYPYFADLRTIQGAVMGIPNGIDPQIDNPDDPWGRPMNYPKIWIQIGNLFQISGEAGFFVFGIFIIFLFLLCAIHFLWCFPSVITLISFCSFATILAVERGNNDLLVFVLIYVSVFLKKKWTKTAVFIVATILKIYPIFALLSIRSNRKQLITICGILSVYFLFIFDQLSSISKGNSAGGTLSYGLRTFVGFLKSIFQHPIGSTYKNLLWMSLILTIAIFILSLFLIKQSLSISSHVLTSIDTRKTDLFLSGAGIYCGTFVFASNWDYRLVFLIFCLPLLTTIPNAFISIVLPFSFLIAMNVIPLSIVLPGVLSALISNSIKLAIFVLLMILSSSILRFQLFENLKLKESDR